MRGSCVVLICVAMLTANSSSAAKTTGEVKVLCVRVLFADFQDAPDLGVISNRATNAETQFEKFSFGKMDITYDTFTALLPNNRSSYSLGTLADAADALAEDAGYAVDDYNIKAYFHGIIQPAPSRIITRSRVWTATGSSLIHEMGHAFGWGHQQRWAAKAVTGEPYNPIHSNGNSDVIDVWSFMTTSTVDTEPAEKWRAGWIPDYVHVRTNTSTKVRLYNYDQKGADPVNSAQRALRVERSTTTKKYFWIGFRSELLNEVDSHGDSTPEKNHHMRQGLVFYWERVQAANGELGASPVALDLHYGDGKATNDQALQPGETYSDWVGRVHITNLGRGGTEPNEYIDVQVNNGSFIGNRVPEPTWDAPFTLKVGEPVVLNVEPNDPDGDAVACMWKKSSGALPENTIATSMTWSWSSAGSKKISVAVSDMKGGVTTLARTITVVDNYPVSQWQGDGSSTAWNSVSNWVSGIEPSSKTDIASWSDAFTGANQPLLDAGIMNRFVHQLRLEPGLNKDVALSLQGAETTLKLYGGIDMSEADQDLAIAGDGAVWIQSWQPWVVSTGTTLSVDSRINMKSNQLTVESHGTTRLSGVFTNGGSIVKTGKGLLSITGATVDVHHVSVEAGTLSVGEPFVLDTFTFISNLTLNGSIVVDIDPSASPNADQIKVAGTLSGNGLGTIHVSNIGASTFSTGQIFQVFNKPLANGASMAIHPVEPAPGMVWVNRLAIDGSIAVIPAPPAGTFGHWVRIGSGLFGPDSRFEADPNGDGIKNGLAYFIGATHATEDSTPLLPVWNYNPGSNAAFVVMYRRLDEATNQIYSAIEYTTNLTNWILAVDGQDGIMETVDDDYYGSGIDRITVCLCDELAPGGQLFGRLVVLDRLSPEVVLPHYVAWAVGMGLTGYEADPTLDLDGDGLSNVEEFLGGTDPEEPSSK